MRRWPTPFPCGCSSRMTTTEQRGSPREANQLARMVGGDALEWAFVPWDAGSRGRSLSRGECRRAADRTASCPQLGTAAHGYPHPEAGRDPRSHLVGRDMVAPLSTCPRIALWGDVKALYPRLPTDRMTGQQLGDVIDVLALVPMSPHDLFRNSRCRDAEVALRWPWRGWAASPGVA